MARRAFDPLLYLVTDRELCGERPLTEVVQRALSGGATMIQVREKRLDTRRFVEQARALRRIAQEHGAALIVNDRVDVALAVDADGVHVGQDDMPAETARSLLGTQRILGVTVTSADQARRAREAGADYVGSSAVFATPTKADTGPPMGLEGLQSLVHAAPLPVVAIGGVNAANAARVMSTGVAGVAVVSAIVAAADPLEAARELARVVGGTVG